MIDQVIQLELGKATAQRGDAVISAVVGGRNCVICMIYPEYAGAVMMSSAAVTANEWSKDLEFMTETARSKFNTKEPWSCIWKAIGNERSLATISQILGLHGASLKGASQTDGGDVEAFLFVQSGRLRVRELAPPSEIKVVEKRRKRVLIVDDSRTMRELLQRILSVDPDLEVVGLADRPSQVEDLIKSLKPDVITMDIDMPEYDGPTLIERLLPKYPLPIVLISALGMEQGRQVLKGLEVGAVDYIQKPVLDKLDEASVIIREKVRTAADIKVKHRPDLASIAKAPPKPFRHSSAMERVVIAIGASTGGPETLTELFRNLPDRIPPILVVQHIPPVFSRAFADRLNGMLPFQVKEAADNDEVKRDQVLIAPGGMQMALKKNGHGLVVRVKDDPPMSGHKPSVDYLFESVAEVAGEFAIGILLTGMGADGAKGLLAMRQKGARTMAQDEASSIVYGMPKAAAQNGSAQLICSVAEIPEKLTEILGGVGGAKRRVG